MNIKEELSKIPNLINKETFRVNGNIFRKEEYQNLKKEIENKFSQYKNIKMNEMLYLIFNDLEERPKCKCDRHGDLTFINYASGYYTFCGKPNVCTLNAANQANSMQSRKKSMTIEEKNLMQEKIKKTNLERYGVDNYFKKPEFIKNNFNEELVKKRDKNRKDNLLKKHGVECVFQLDEVKEKIKNTNREKYGVPNYMQTYLPENTLNKLNDYKWMENNLNKYSISHVSKILNCYPCTVINSMQKHNIKYVYKNISSEEYIIQDILDRNNISYTKNDKSILENNHELDFYLSEYNLAIEVNGLYWHSEKIRPDRNYHQNKYEKCKSKNITLLQFWDFEINNKYEIIESMILNKCKKINKKIYARNCIVREISNTESAIFINKNHLQNITDNQISLSYGIFYKGELVSVICFRRKNEKYVLTRFCNLLNLIVIGSFSKLLKFFITKNTNCNEVITYSDNRYSSGDLYLNNDFIKTRVNDVSYYYTKDFKELKHRSNFNMIKMSKDQNFIYDKNLTDHENIISNGYTRVYGCKIDTWKYTK